MRQTVRATLLCTLALLPLISACGGREIDPPGSGTSAIDGDWFACENAACTRLDDDGMRFNKGRWARLDAPGGSYEPGETYQVQRPWGTYSFDGKTLTLSLASGTSGGFSGVDTVELAIDPDNPDRATGRVCHGQQCGSATEMRRVGPGAPIDPSKLGGAAPSPTTPVPPPDAPGAPPSPRP